MMNLRVLAFSILTLAALACGDNKGEPCRVDGDCGDELICATFAACPGDECSGTCAQECRTDDDCEEEDDVCRDEPSTDRRYCRYVGRSE